MRNWGGVLTTISCAMLLVGVMAHAGEHHDYAPYKGSAEFERIKQLAGRWQGTSTMDGGEEPAQVEYRVTSGGSAIVEMLFPGTPHEMVSIYTERGGKLVLTHYCMLGNQPRLQLGTHDNDRLEFSLAGDSGIDAAEPHMHALSLSFDGPNKVTQRWAMFESGKEKDATTIALTRVQ